MAAVMQPHTSSRAALRRHKLPCVLMRAGTSKGLFIHKKDLPASQAEWGPHLISALGSRGGDRSQLDGIGGGSSTTSKVAVVSPSARQDADVDWTFVQVAVGKESVDLTGTCGNMVSGVGPFAVQEGMVKAQPGQTKLDVRVYNTNTDRVVVETVEIDELGEYEEDGEYTIPGVSNSGSEVKCAFVDPAGSMTGTLFPSGHEQQILTVDAAGASPDIPDLPPFDARVTIIDAANPFVLIDGTSITSVLNNLPSPEARHAVVETIRRQGAVEMGLAKTVEDASKTRGTPKVALLYPPIISQQKSTPDLRVQSYSMGLPHPSLQLTGAVCLATALSSQGTIAADLSSNPVIADGEKSLPSPERTPSPGSEVADAGLPKEKTYMIEHSKGAIKVEVATYEDGSVKSCAVSRTARRLFEGSVRYYL